MTDGIEEKYKNILSNIEELYYEVDLTGNLTFLNGSMVKILGYSMEELIGMNNRQYMSPETAKRVYQTFNQVYRTGIPTKAFDWELIRKDGTIRVLETSVSLMRDPKGQPIGFYGIGRDITDRKQIEEQERSLRRAKDKALHQLSHELQTPLSIALGITRIFKKKIELNALHSGEGGGLSILENHLHRLLEIQRKCNHIIQYSQTPNGIPVDQEPNQLWKRPERDRETIFHHTAPLNSWNKMTERSLLTEHTDVKTVNLFPLVQHVLARAKDSAQYRNIIFHTEGEENLCLLTDSWAIEEIVEGLLKNAVENTPDEGKVRITLGTDGNLGFLKVKDFGIGITEENLKYIFDGFFATREVESYVSKKAYDFYAGGKGLDLFKMKVYGQHFGFDISAKSRRCIYLPTDHDLCPGRISLCPHCKETLDCYSSGGSTFCVSFPISKKGNEHDRRNSPSQPPE
jgi:PAS domain S-box-containing protein